jgi:organic radical activating enzyme
MNSAQIFDKARRDGPVARFRIYQVELSAPCNMKCSYCPHPTMKRPKGVMSAEVLEACIRWIRKDGGTRIVLHHFGEPLMHPHLNERLRQVANGGLSIQFSTNGLLLEKSWDTLVATPTPIAIMLAVHQWARHPEEEYLAAIEKWTKRAEGTNVSILRAYNVKGNRFTFHKWANGIDDGWDTRECPFLKYNLAVVLWNGDIATCCVDHEGETARVNILSQDAWTHQSDPWKACARCDVGRLMHGEVW